MWQFNNAYGGSEMRGWLWVQGYWSWGAVLTWHAVDIAGLGFYWVCYSWHWNNMRMVWDYNLLVSDGSVQPKDVEPWMVHCG